MAAVRKHDVASWSQSSCRSWSGCGPTTILRAGNRPSHPHGAGKARAGHGLVAAAGSRKHKDYQGHRNVVRGEIG